MFERVMGMAAGGEGGGPKGTILPAGCRRAGERRQVVRQTFGRRGQIARDAGKQAGRWQTVMVQDVSTNGVGIVSDEAIPVGQTLVLKLKDAAEQPLRVRCIVRRCEAGGYGGAAYLVGAEYQQILQESPLTVREDEPEHPAVNGSTPDEATGRPAHPGGTGGAPLF